MSDSDSPQRVPIWQWPLLANLMAPAVACAWLAGLGIVYRLYVPPAYFVMLAAAAWTVYTLDGLLDARQPAAGQAGRIDSPRARFHRCYRAWFLVLVPCVSVGGFLLAGTQATSTLVVVSGGMSVLIFLYLVHAQALRSASWALVPKEIFAGILFAMGIMLPVLDLQGRFPFADPSSVAVALDKGLLAFLQWLGWLVVATLGSMAYEPATLLLAVLFATNCLLTAAHENRGGEVIDPGSAGRVAPRLMRLAPWAAASLAVGSVLLAQLVPQASSRPLSFMAGLSGGLMLVVHLLGRRQIIPAPAVCFLLDCALLAPIGLLPAAVQG